MTCWAELSEEKLKLSKIIMVFFIKKNILSHSPSPGQVMRFGKMCFGSWALIFRLIFGEVLWETIHFANAFDQEGNRIVHTRRVGEGERKNWGEGYLFWQNLAKNAEADKKLALHWAASKVLQSAAFLSRREKLCFFLSAVSASLIMINSW